jgi:hypothetical protein
LVVAGKQEAIQEASAFLVSLSVAAIALNSSLDKNQLLETYLLGLHQLWWQEGDSSLRYKMWTSTAAAIECVEDMTNSRRQ